MWEPSWLEFARSPPAWGSGQVRLPPTVQKGDEGHRLNQVAPGCAGSICLSMLALR